jgi:hypothetical protein
MSAEPLDVVEQRRLFTQLVSPEFVNALEPTLASAVYTPFIVVWLLIYQRLHGNATLSEAVAEFLTNFPRQALPDCQRVREDKLSSNTGGYSRARTRLAVNVVHTVAQHVSQSLLPTTPPSWNERRFFLLDGTTAQLPATEELRQAYPPAKNQHGSSHWPVLQMLVAHDLASGLALPPEFGPMYGPNASSELSLTLEILKRLPEKAVLLADRNFGIFRVAYAAQSSGRDVLTRLTKPRFQMLVRNAKADQPGRWAVTWKPSRWDRKSHPDLPADAEVRGWVHEVPVSPKLTLWLFSTLDASGADLAEVYRRRADVETDIRDIKQTLSMDCFSGKDSDMVEKELLVSVVAYNLVNQVRRLAAKQASVQPRRLSFAGVWSLVKSFLAAVSEGLSEQQCQKRFENLLRWAAQRKLPKRAEERSYPRTVSPRTQPYPKRKPTPKQT